MVQRHRSVRSFSLIVVLSMLAGACSSASFDIASSDDGGALEAGDDGGSSEDVDVLAARQDSAVVEAGGDAGVGDAGSDVGMDAGSVDVGAHDAAHDASPVETDTPTTCARYCTDFGSPSAYKRLGESCLGDIDCCSGDCFDSRPGDGVPGMCVAPSSPGWCGGVTEWCADAGGKACVR